MLTCYHEWHRGQCMRCGEGEPRRGAWPIAVGLVAFWAGVALMAYCAESVHAADIVPPRVSYGCALEPCYALILPFERPPPLGSDEPRVVWACFWPDWAPDDPARRFCVPESPYYGSRTALIVRQMGSGEVWWGALIYERDQALAPGAVRFVAPLSGVKERGVGETRP